MILNQQNLLVRINHISKLAAVDAVELRHAYDYIHTDPRGSVAKSGILLETVLLGLYIEVMGREPRKVELGDMLHENQVKRRIDGGPAGPAFSALTHFVREMRNRGAHADRKVLSKYAADVLGYLCDVLEWRFNISVIHVNNPEDIEKNEAPGRIVSAAEHELHKTLKRLEEEINNKQADFNMEVKEAVLEIESAIGEVKAAADFPTFQRAIVALARVVFGVRHMDERLRLLPMPPYDLWLPFKDGAGSVRVAKSPILPLKLHYVKETAAAIP